MGGVTQFSSGIHAKRTADPLAVCFGKVSPDFQPRPEFDRPLTNPANRLLDAFRLIDAGRSEYADWVRDIDANPQFWMRQGGQYPQYTPAEVEHARAVLSRIPLAFPTGEDTTS